MNARYLTYGKKGLFLLLEWILFAAIGGLLLFGITMLLSKLFPGVQAYYNADDIFDRPLQGVLVSYIPLLAVSLSTIYIVHCLIFKRTWDLLGFDIGGMVPQFLRGGRIAVVILLAGFILLLAFGQMNIIRLNWNASLFFGFIAFFLIQSAVEEVIGRSYLIPAIEARFNTISALLISSLIFSLVHGTNANVSTVGLINIFLAGLLMGLLFVRYRKVWAPLGMHACWNFLQGSFLGYEVSGIDVYSYIDSEENGIDLFTGGRFGFEGSILATVGLAVFCLYIWRRMPAHRIFKMTEDANNG